jgi:hypothetical protein
MLQKHFPMNDKNTIFLPILIASLLVAPQMRAQSDMNYNDNDLLLNFRDSVDNSGSDLEVDLGNVSTFVSTVNALPNGTAVLDSGTGYNNSGYTPQFTGASLIGQIGNSTGTSDGSADNIGFSAAAENLGAPPGTAAINTLWLTRVIASSEVVTGGTPSFQSTASAQNRTAGDIQLIGYEAESPANGGTGSALAGAINAGVVADNDPESYHTLGEASVNNANVISYGGFVTGTSTSPLEATPTSGTIYEALWEVPVSGNGSSVYLGYFAFQTNGELDFTVASAAKPPPPQVSLTILRTVTNSVQVLWPNTGSFTLQQNTNLAATADWTTSAYTVSTSNGTNSITISPPTGTLFFRLSSP